MVWLSSFLLADTGYLDVRLQPLVFLATATSVAMPELVRLIVNLHFRYSWAFHQVYRLRRRRASTYRLIPQQDWGAVSRLGAGEECYGAFTAACSDICQWNFLFCVKPLVTAFFLNFSTIWSVCSAMAPFRCRASRAPVASFNGQGKWLPWTPGPRIIYHVDPGVP